MVQQRASEADASRAALAASCEEPLLICLTGKKSRMTAEPIRNRAQGSCIPILCCRDIEAAGRPLRGAS